MNRKSFFKHFGGMVAAVAIAQNVVAKLAVSVVEGAKATTRLILNPEYTNAKYEVAFVMGIKAIKPTDVIPIIFRRGETIPLEEGQKLVKEQFPIRFNSSMMEEVPYKSIHPFKQI